MNALRLFDLTGKTALVTGGSRGLGLQIAEALGEAGAQILISARTDADLKIAHERLAGFGIAVHHVAADNTKDEDVLRLVDDAMMRLGRIDILVNNAGMARGAAAEEHPPHIWDEVMNLNIRSMFMVSQQVARRSMIPNRSGRIINMASTEGLRGSPGLLSYNASKGAVVNFTRSLAINWGVYGITVNALAPGLFPSRMTAGLLRAHGEAYYIDATPLRRIGDDEDLKGAALLFASAAGKHITGQILAIDGGVTAG